MKVTEIPNVKAINAQKIQDFVLLSNGTDQTTHFFLFQIDHNNQH